MAEKVGAGESPVFISTAAPDGRILRVGGDEFVIVLPRTNRHQVRRIARRLLTALGREVVHVDDKPIRVQASMGIAMYPDDATTVEGLLAKADAAMYTAKRQGGNRLAGLHASSPKGFPPGNGP